MKEIENHDWGFIRGFVLGLWMRTGGTLESLKTEQPMIYKILEFDKHEI